MLQKIAATTDGMQLGKILAATPLVANPLLIADDMDISSVDGLCLSATYDAVFDRHFISFDDDYRMILAPSLREYYMSQVFQLRLFI